MIKKIKNKCSHTPKFFIKYNTVLPFLWWCPDMMRINQENCRILTAYSRFTDIISGRHKNGCTSQRGCGCTCLYHCSSTPESHMTLKTRSTCSFIIRLDYIIAKFHQFICNHPKDIITYKKSTINPSHH